MPNFAKKIRYFGPEGVRLMKFFQVGTLFRPRTSPVISHYFIWAFWSIIWSEKLLILVCIFWGLESDVQNFVYHYFKDGIPDGVFTSRFPKHECLPVYAVIYYCFRCGCLKGALEAAKKTEKQILVTTFETLISKRHSPLPMDIWNGLCSEYNRNVKNKSEDVYEIALYCIIAKADPKPDGNSPFEVLIHNVYE